jgi:perosamine synthetase
MNKNIVRELILTAGPSITSKEIVYAIDATRNGWNKNHSDYIKKFENTIASYVGVKYAVATSSCTGALHLGLLAMGVGPGDEVIVPDISWIATASAVVYTGAKPVFCDIDKKNWVMDLDSLEKMITSKTKAVIPVHLYGNPVNMTGLLELKKKYGFWILEDAAPSFGTIFEGRKTGSFGDASAFSFQGAKAFVSGEGGVFLTNNIELYNRFKIYWDHGRDPLNPRIDQILQVGYKYKMSNVQASIALAQIERVEEIVEKKRNIYDYYVQFLGETDGIQLNSILENTRQLIWMTSIILDESIPISRDAFIQELKKMNVDSRPFFPPMSKYSMFGSYSSNPNAEFIGSRGINLPSGHNLTVEEIEYISACVKTIIANSISKENKLIEIKKSGWLKLRDDTVDKLRVIKSGDFDNLIFEHNAKLYNLTPMTQNDEKIESIETLADWRTKSQKWFPTSKPISLEGTKQWLVNSVINNDDRVLFWIEDFKGQKIGHVGLFRFDFIQSRCEIDNVIRGVEGDKGLIQKATSLLISYVFEKFGIEKIYFRVFSDNLSAIICFEHLGFREIQRRPQSKSSNDQYSEYFDNNLDFYEETDRYLITMKLDNNLFSRLKNV